MRRPGSAYNSNDRILVVGGGPAGLAAGEELRRQGFTGDVTIIGAEPYAPYDRPAGSKGILTGHQKPADLELEIAPGVELNWQLGRRAVDLDVMRRIITVDTGEAYEFDGLVIATGSHSVFPKGWPEGEPGLHAMHTIDDAWAVRRELRDAARVAIVGGGLTGCEVACGVVAQARQAVIIDSKPHVMNRAIGEPIGTLVTEEHRSIGIEMRLGRRVKDLDRRKDRWCLTLDDGSNVWADLVVVTAGERPDTEWLDDSGLDVSDGVLCDESLRVVGTEGVVAAGVVARWPNLRYGPEPTRCGQWIAALEHGKAAAQALLAGDREVPPVTILPRFWSSQFGLRIQVAGDLVAGAEVGLTELRPGRRDTAAAGVLASYYHNHRLVGLVAVNAPHAFTSTTRTLLNGMPDIQRATNVTPIRRLVAS